MYFIEIKIDVELNFACLQRLLASYYKLCHILFTKRKTPLVMYLL